MTRSPVALPVCFDGAVFAWSGQDSKLLDGFSLDLDASEITAIVGPSGCGKSTLLRLAAGLLELDSGWVRPGSPSGCAMVFQQPTLLPWRTVGANVGLPLQLSGLAVEQRRQRVQGVLERVELLDVEDQLPRSLSGGMQMRVALARAWVTAPGLLLMDEPFAALDALTRRRMHRRFEELWTPDRPTVLLVTHDIDEAVLLADRVVVVSGRPLCVVAELVVDLPRPRAASLRHDPKLGSQVARVEAALLQAGPDGVA